MPRGYVHPSFLGGRKRKPGGSGLVAVEVAGAQQFAELAKRLKGADKAYRKELRIGLNRAVKPLREQVKTDLPQYMPDRYALVMRKALKIKTVIRMSGKTAGVRLTATGKGRHKSRDTRNLNRGTLRHPLWGNRDWWYAQKVRRGFWDEPLRAGAPDVRREIVRVITEVNKRIEGGT